jgi:hypothetical protein
LFGRELQLPCELLFGSSPDKENSTIDNVADLVDNLHNIHNYAHQHLKLAIDQMKTRYDKLVNYKSYHEGDRTVALLSNPHKGEFAQAPAFMGGPVQGK